MKNTNVIDAYGSFEEPEEKTEIEIIENPLEVIKSTYLIFKKIAKKIIDEKARNERLCYREDWCSSYNNYGSNSNTYEQLYSEAAKIIKEIKIRNEKITGELIPETIKKEAQKYDGTGLFLSVILNETEIEQMTVEEFPDLDNIGYKIKKEKTLILGPKTNSNIIGMLGEGNVINYGNLHKYAYCMKDGIQINNRSYGSQRIHVTNKGLQINLFPGSGKYINGEIGTDTGKIYFEGDLVDEKIKISAEDYFIKNLWKKGSRSFHKYEECKNGNLLEQKQKIEKILEQEEFLLLFEKTKFEEVNKTVQKLKKFDLKKQEEYLAKILEKLVEINCSCRIPSDSGLVYKRS